MQMEIVMPGMPSPLSRYIQSKIWVIGMDQFVHQPLDSLEGCGCSEFHNYFDKFQAVDQHPALVNYVDTLN